jgi:DNA-binding CsgD family transcriptional regulator
VAIDHSLSAHGDAGSGEGHECNSSPPALIRECCAGTNLGAAGRVRVDVTEADPLLRLHAVSAARALGYAVDDEAGGGQAGPRPLAAHFVGLDSLDLCVRCGLAGNPNDGVLRVGYSAGPPALAAVHQLHGCIDLMLELRAVGGAPRFAHLVTPSAFAGVLAGGLSVREADVLLLVLNGFSTEGIAARLYISPATARSHCRAVLLKCGAGDRRSLCARLLGAAVAARRRSECLAGS